MSIRPLAAAVLLATAATADAVGAQVGLGLAYERPRFMVGYVANAPELMLGGMVAVLPPFLGGWGVHVDAKRAVQDPGAESSFQPDVTRTEAETVLQDVVVQEKTYWESYNAAVVRAFRPDLILYLGGGAAKEARYVEYFDPEGTSGEFGYYWVRDEPPGGWRANAMAGMYFRLMRHLALQFGVEATPPGLTIGVLGVL